MISFIKEFLRFIKVRKKYVLMPVFFLMATLGGLLILSEGSAIAPFIYSLF